MEDQPPPKANNSRPIWELVVEDMKERDRVGRERYGTPLQAGNGRDALVDAYQEALDLVVYLRQAIAEREQVVAAVEAAVFDTDMKKRRWGLWSGLVKARRLLTGKTGEAESEFLREGELLEGERHE